MKKLYKSMIFPGVMQEKGGVRKNIEIIEIHWQNGIGGRRLFPFEKQFPRKGDTVVMPFAGSDRQFNKAKENRDAKLPAKLADSRTELAVGHHTCPSEVAKAAATPDSPALAPATELAEQTPTEIVSEQGNINIHYVYNQTLKVFDDFKLKP